jgi:hypothetical protein
MFTRNFYLYFLSREDNPFYRIISSLELILRLTDMGNRTADKNKNNNEARYIHTHRRQNLKRAATVYCTKEYKY